MKGFKKIAILILFVLIISNISIVYGANSAIDDLDIIKQKAFSLGLTDGKTEGAKGDKDTPYYRFLPRNEEIINRFEEEYGLEYDEQYGKDIIESYIQGFEIGYNLEIDRKDNKGDKQKEEKGDYADDLAKTLGELYGYRDFYDGKRSNWNRAIPSNKTIIDMYNLNNETGEFRNSFLNNFREKFKEGYEEGYKKANFEPIKISYEEGIEDGEYFGNILGKIYGVKDYFDGKSLNYKRNLPSDTVIIREYSLNRDSSEYREGFLVGFKREYEKSYNDNYRNMNLEKHKKSYEEGYEHGKTVGTKVGETNAIMDYYLKLDNNWKRQDISSYTIIKENNLMLESEKYRDGFISGYKEGLMEGYTTTFQNLNIDTISEKFIVDTIAISGGEISDSNNNIYLNIEKGTYYNPVVISIDILPDSFFSLTKPYIKGSEFFKIDIKNKSFESDNNKNIELKFEYYGDEKGGIYKLVDNKWFYLPSTIEEGFITTKLKPKSFSKDENIFVVLIDKNATLFYDIRGHWAKDEINTFARRGIVSGYGDGTFKPNKNLSRGEFLSILSKVYDWDTKSMSYDTAKKFKDYNTFKYYKDVINYAVNKNYIQGYSDNTFKPNNPITYKEVETIMERITDNKNFRWYNTAARILYDKGYRCKSYNSMNNHITRAEVVYMLYLINEWKY